MNFNYGNYRIRKHVKTLYSYVHDMNKVITQTASNADNSTKNVRNQSNHNNVLYVVFYHFFDDINYFSKK